MKRPLFSVIIPTQGRPTLARTLASIKAPPGESVETIIVADTYGQVAAGLPELADEHDAPYLECDAGRHSYGHDQINYGLQYASGDWINCQDDDDVYAPDAFAVMARTIAQLDRPRPLLFRFKSYYGPVFWDREGFFAQNHIGGHCGVFPNLPGRVGCFGPHYQGDFTWLQSTIDLWPNGLDDAVWVDQVISIARPM